MHTRVLARAKSNIHKRLGRGLCLRLFATFFDVASLNTIGILITITAVLAATASFAFLLAFAFPA